MSSVDFFTYFWFIVQLFLLLVSVASFIVAVKLNDWQLALVLGGTFAIVLGFGTTTLINIRTAQTITGGEELYETVAE